MNSGKNEYVFCTEAKENPYTRISLYLQFLHLPKVTLLFNVVGKN